MKKIYLVTLLFFVISFKVFCQNISVIDSLKQIFESSKPDSVRLNACKQILTQFIQIKDSISLVKYIEEGVALAEKQNDDKIKYNFKMAEAALLLETRDYDRSLSIYKNVLRESKAKKLKEITAISLTGIGLCYYYKTEYDKAMPVLMQAMEIKKSLNDNKGVGRAYLKIAKVHFEKGEFKQSLDLCEKALQISLSIGDTKNIISSYNDLGIVYSSLNDLQKATDNLLKALEVAKVHNAERLPMIYGNLGVINLNKKDYNKATYYFKKCLELFKKRKDELNIAISRSTLANLYSMQGNYEESLRLYDSTNVYYIKSGHKNILSANYNRMGFIHRQLGDLSKARYYFRKAALLNEEMKSKSDMATNYGLLGTLYLRENQQDSAFYYFEKTFKLYEETNNTNSLINIYREIGEIYTDKANIPKAIEFYQKALTKAENEKDTIAIADIHAAMGDFYMEQNMFEKAYSRYENALYSYNSKEVTTGVANMNAMMARVFNQQQKYGMAVQFGKKALNTYQKFKDTCSFGKVYLTIAQSHIALKNTDSTSHYLQKALINAQDCKDVQSTLLASVYGELGAFYQDQSIKDSAFVAYEEALKYATLSKNRLVIKNAAEALYPVYEKRGQFKKAYETFRIFHDNQKALFNEENTRALVKQEYEKQIQQQAFLQQKKEAELARQKWLTTTLIGACLAFILLGLAVYRNYQNKNKANKLLKAKNLEISAQQRKLEALDQTKSQFFANISHELRTPLTLISSPIQSLLQSAREQFLPSTKETLRLMYRNTEALKSLVDDILALSKLESNKLALQHEEVFLPRLLQQVVTNFDSLASHQGIRFESYFEEVPDAIIRIDAGKTEKILNNLLSNAIKHTPSGGTVSIKAVRKNKHLIIQVKDTGRGIDPKDQPFIFERFYQSPHPDAPLQGGTGIGLALAKEFCELMGGTIEVESTLNKGSSFTIRLPYEEVESPAEIAASNDIPEDVDDATLAVNKSFTATTRKILIVEDHPDMQFYINSLVAPEFTTFLAANGKEAVQILDHEAVDLIISDVMMPEMDGYALLQYLKDHKKYYHIPVIMLTALGDVAHKLQALTIGVDDYLTKPFAPEELMVRIHNLLVRSETRLRWQEDEERATEAITLSSEEKGDEDLSPHQLEKEWLKRVEKEISSNLENEEFRLTDLAGQFNLGYRQFLRRIKVLTGLSLKQYQQEIALQRARELLENGIYGNASAVAYSVGMNNVTRFSKLYEGRFGKRPGDYFASFSLLDEIPDKTG